MTEESKVSKLKEAIEILKELNEIKEIADLVIDEIVPYIDRFSTYMVEMKIKQIKQFEGEGFTREESISLTNDI